MNLENEKNISNRQNTLHKNLNFLGAEAYKLLRANLMFAMADDNEKKCHVIGVTSSVRNEGKSTTSINLSYAIAEAGKKVLLIDADLRLPTIEKKMEIEKNPGLTDLLVTKANESTEMFRPSRVSERWTVLPAGSVPPNPSELLGSRKMEALMDQLKDNFDYIIVDLPPVNIVSDALTVSHLLDGMIVVVKEDYTDRRALNECIRKLEMFKVKMFGFVLNDVKDSNKTYGRSRKYYNKYYKYYK